MMQKRKGLFLYLMQPQEYYSIFLSLSLGYYLLTILMILPLIALVL